MSELLVFPTPRMKMPTMNRLTKKVTIKQEEISSESIVKAAQITTDECKSLNVSKLVKF